MLSTIVSATFKYRGHYVTARRMVDTVTGKFFCWQGYVNDDTNSSIAHKSLNKFEEQFKAFADTLGDKPAFEVF